jgi:hypothetical protein
VPTNRGIDKENVVYTHVGVLSAIKRNEIVSFAGKNRWNWTSSG